jgi:hypothetical protein
LHDSLIAHTHGNSCTFQRNKLLMINSIWIFFYILLLFLNDKLLVIFRFSHIIDSCHIGSFHCDKVRCIPSRLVCDDFPDCEDRTDEERCTSPVYSSCHDIWTAGYQMSGLYKLGMAFKIYITRIPTFYMTNKE